MVKNEGRPSRRLRCAHSYHHPGSEQRWKSPEFVLEAQRRKAFVEKLISDLRKGRTSPGPFPPIPNTYENWRKFDVKRHFHFLRSRLPREEYQDQVTVYEKAALINFFSRPPCYWELKGIPLERQEVHGLIQHADLTTPRTGGRPVSRKIQERDFRIAQLANLGKTHLEICQVLDTEDVSIPVSWRRLGLYTWHQAYHQRKERVQPLLSKASKKS